MELSLSVPLPAMMTEVGETIRFHGKTVADIDGEISGKHPAK